jgi:hypothetical protein
MATRFIANEKTSARVSGTFCDKDKAPIPGSAIDVLLLSIYLAGDPTKLIRSSDDLNGDPNVSVDEAGILTWDVQPFETEILLPTDVALGSPEIHAALIEYSWNNPRSGTLIAPFSTSSGSKFITVTMPGHGLEFRDQLFFITPVDVAGLDIGGQYIVRSVIDANTFTIEHFKAATATTSGAGGSVPWYSGGDVQSTKMDMIISRVDPV